MLHLHSTHECAQWVVALLTCYYCVYLSRFGCMPVCVFLYICMSIHYMQSDYPAPINKPLLSCCQPLRTAAVTMETKCINVSWRLSSITVCIFCGCGCALMHEYHQFWQFWLCIFSAIRVYFDDLRNKVEMNNSPAFSIYHYLKLCDLFGCFYVGQRKANACWTYVI